MSRFAKRLRFPALALGLAAGVLFACVGGGAGTEAPPTQQPTEEAAATSPATQQPTEEAATTSPATQQPTEEAAATSPPTQQPTEEAAATSPPTQQPTEEAATPSPATQQPTEEVAPTTPPSQPQPEVGHQTGDRAPDFMVTTTDGEQLTLASFQDRPVLLYFFATW